MNKYESLAAAIWQDPIPMDTTKLGDLVWVVGRRGVYRRFFTANAAVMYGQAERHSHISRYWAVGIGGGIEPLSMNAGRVLRIAKIERDLQILYKMRATNQAILQAMKGLADAE